MEEVGLRLHPDLAQLGGVAVPAPHDDAGESGLPCLEHHEVAEARLVVATAVVDDQHAAGCRPLDARQQHVDAAQVGDGARRTAEQPPREQRHQVGGRKPQGHPEPHAGVGDGGGRNRGGERIHATSLPQLSTSFVVKRPTARAPKTTM
jgi:hypothetical protein